MGYSTRSIPFFSDEIEICPHTATRASLIGRPVSIRVFSAGRPVSLERVEDGAHAGELIARCGRFGTANLDFIQGPES